MSISKLGEIHGRQKKKKTCNLNFQVPICYLEIIITEHRVIKQTDTHKNGRGIEGDVT
jgi:hypothetical protein